MSIPATIGGLTSRCRSHPPKTKTVTRIVAPTSPIPVTVVADSPGKGGQGGYHGGWGGVAARDPRAYIYICIYIMYIYIYVYIYIHVCVEWVCVRACVAPACSQAEAAISSRAVHVVRKDRFPAHPPRRLTSACLTEVWLHLFVSAIVVLIVIVTAVAALQSGASGAASALVRFCPRACPSYSAVVWVFRVHEHKQRPSRRSRLRASCCCHASGRSLCACFCTREGGRVQKGEEYLGGKQCRKVHLAQNRSFPPQSSRVSAAPGKALSPRPGCPTARLRPTARRQSSEALGTLFGIFHRRRAFRVRGYDLF